MKYFMNGICVLALLLISSTGATAQNGGGNGGANGGSSGEGCNVCVENTLPEWSGEICQIEAEPGPGAEIECSQQETEPNHSVCTLSGGECEGGDPTARRFALPTGRVLGTGIADGAGGIRSACDGALISRVYTDVETQEHLSALRSIG